VTRATDGGTRPRTDTDLADEAAGRVAARVLERRGRPRDAAVDTAVVEAVLRLLEEGVTISRLSMERIARRAGVGKATLYRRWSGKGELMLDVMRSLDDPGVELAGVSLRDDLVACLESSRRRAVAKRSSALLRNVLAQFQSDPDLWRAYHDTTIAGRRAQLRDVLRRGVDSGEIRSGLDLDLLGDLFMGPMLVRAMLRPDATLEEGLAEQIVDTVLAGVRTQPSG
jgi:AcrR family transcriptional regulator